MKTTYLTALTVSPNNKRFFDGVLCAVGSYLQNLSCDADLSELHILLGSRGVHDAELHAKIRQLNHERKTAATVRVYDSSEYNFSGSNDVCNVTRHAAMARHLRLLYPIGLADDGARVMTFDARDTLFFGDPFYSLLAVTEIDLVSKIDPDAAYCVYVFGEGFDYSEDPWNAADLQNLRQHVPDVTANVALGFQKSLPVLNGGFVAGRIQPVVNFLTMRYLFGLPSCLDKGKGTDQVQLNFIAHTCEVEFGLPIRQVMPSESLAVIHGHGIWHVKEGRFLPHNDPIEYAPASFGFKGSNSGKPVAVLHQWDRCPDPEVLTALRQRYLFQLKE